mgnify:CR=1 FL=1
MVKKLFEGVRIADITAYVAGPLTTKYFAEAEVIKVETARRIPGGE